jgi:hypothetical protein
MGMPKQPDATLRRFPCNPQGLCMQCPESPPTAWASAGFFIELLKKQAAFESVNDGLRRP